MSLEESVEKLFLHAILEYHKEVRRTGEHNHNSKWFILAKYIEDCFQVEIEKTQYLTIPTPHQPRRNYPCLKS